MKGAATPLENVAPLGVYTPLWRRLHGRITIGAYGLAGEILRSDQLSPGGDVFIGLVNTSARSAALLVADGSPRQLGVGGTSAAARKRPGAVATVGW
jgi:hypothetical protein